MEKQNLSTAELDQAVERVLRLALNKHQAGDLSGAEDLYRLILETQPNHADTNHNLGVLAVQSNNPEGALPYFLRAIEANSNASQYWVSYLNTLVSCGQFDVATDIFTLALDQGGALEQSLIGQLKDKGEPFQSTIEKRYGINGSNRESEEMGVTSKLGKLGRRPSKQEMDKILKLYGLGRLKEVEALARALAKRYPDDSFPWKTLGAVLQEQHQYQEALIASEIAIQVDPKDIEILNNHANLLASLGRIGEAEAYCKKAIELDPKAATPLDTLGVILFSARRFQDAEVFFRKALELQPNFANSLSNLSLILRQTQRLVEAEELTRKALILNPRQARTYSNLGLILNDAGRYKEATEANRKALALEPTLVETHSNLLFGLSNDDSVDAEALFKEHLQFAKKFEVPLRPHWELHANGKVKNRKLNIGFVSGDFNMHPVANFIEPILVHLSKHNSLNLYAFYNESLEDFVTARLRQYFFDWQSVSSLNDDELTALIRAKEIDILIDLSGHTAKHRLLTFARKPAPLQITWMGYPGTTGLSAIDYYFTDAFFLPDPSFDRLFTEKLIRLPASAPFLPYSPSPFVKPAPALSNNYLTFGSFNRIGKITPAVVSVWAQLMNEVSDSVLVLGGMPSETEFEVLRSRFKEHGVATERLHYFPRAAMDGYLAKLETIDLCLDTFPYNGGTTTLHSAWMGVPTLTMAGEAVATRTGACIMSHLGLQRMIAHNADEFVKEGAYWSKNLDELAVIRMSLRKRLQDSTISNPSLIAESLNKAFHQIWARWCDDLPPIAFTVA
ncbi:MAG: tetratricopeptide repeat protein [Burkholderiaceae bacterium]|nr:tetratricopeptide repeat protein [Burkholderiaceae bacterium]